MRCPYCGSAYCRPMSEATVEDHTKGFGAGKGCLGWLLFGPMGWLCGLCGMGKGKTTTRIHNYWVCDNCGKRFN